MLTADQPYEAVIGLEVHCQLLTETKAFSPESAAFGADANTRIDPVSLAHPGTLPVMNEKVVEFAVRIGLATRCHIAPVAEFARKQYFYPDLPKGYQISQYDTPLCYGGVVEIDVEDEYGSERKQIGLTRIHIEEDAGKSLHDQDPVDTLLDFNRCGVPLIEIVSEPDLRSPREASLFVQKIRQIVRYLGICDGNMEEGSLRCDANVSVRKAGDTALGTKTEVKNINSFRNVERALEYEISRQIRLVDKGEKVVQETRLWDASRSETRSMRTKEEEHDYRYFPDPDLVPVIVDEAMRAAILADLPEMPDARRERYVRDLGLPVYDAGVLTEERSVAEYFESVFEALRTIEPDADLREHAKAVSNVVMTDVLRSLKSRPVTDEGFPIEPGRLAHLISMRLADKISSSGAQQLFDAMISTSMDPESLAAEMKLLQISDEGALVPVIDEVIAEHPKQLAQYRAGKQSLIGFFIGQVMRRFEGAPDPQVVRALLVDRLSDT
ncbi:MAG: Asp-tRNA(Asn)/Glu-tRNA(Gln) amidotransferase subunit GatB [Bacteroidota bacterium]